MNQINPRNFLKYVILFIVVTTSTFYIPNCSILNQHAGYIGLLAATTFVLLDRYMPHTVIVETKQPH
jgi:NADH:ubiquinone oxidoreductase subunit 3 (subunit A)